MIISLTTDDDSQGCLVLQEGEWFIERAQYSQDQGQQHVPSDRGDGKEAEKHVEGGPLNLPHRTVLRKAERNELLTWVKRTFVTVSPEEAADILNVVRETVYRMVDRTDLDRVPGIRHVKIPLSQVIALAQGLNKDGTEKQP